jgi:hypothetical protein
VAPGWYIPGATYLAAFVIRYCWRFTAGLAWIVDDPEPLAEAELFGTVPANVPDPVCSTSEVAPSTWPVADPARSRTAPAVLLAVESVLPTVEVAAPRAERTVLAT